MDIDTIIARFLLAQAGINAHNNLENCADGDQYEITEAKMYYDRTEIVNHGIRHIITANKLTEILIESIAVKHD